jgi:hypothetical protein
LLGSQLGGVLLFRRGFTDKSVGRFARAEARVEPLIFV